ncbi:MAG: T9SS type A sorting domain-containing protein, partial [Bacteroidia bacterium]|nr:T9SS type A sorting domain-containing protein [Bacteroidia bacterium]
GANVTTFYNLSINNPMGISLSQTINISNQLMMTDGVIYSSAVTPVVCLAGASANLGSTISYVDGPMQQIVASTSAQTINYPVGKNGSFRPIILAVQHSSVTPVTYTSEVWNVSARSMGYSLPPSLGWVSDMRYYTITRTPVANLSNARVTLTYGADDFVTDPSYLRVARDNGSSTWLDHGGTGTASGSGSITSSNFTGFNTYFTLANATGGINPLPVEYTRFTAAANGNQVVLDWATASETNSDYFEVERSRDGSTFQPIGRIAAAGFSTTVRNYQFPDKKPFSGTNYYRLRQVDQNGTYEYSAVRAVHFSQQVLNVFPNPVSNRVIHLDLPGLEDTGIQAGLYDLSGKLIFNTGMPEAGVGQAKIQLPSEVMAGTYLLKIRDAAGNSWQEKIIVTL